MSCSVGWKRKRVCEADSSGYDWTMDPQFCEESLGKNWDELLASARLIMLLGKPVKKSELMLEERSFSKGSIGDETDNDENVQAVANRMAGRKASFEGKAQGAEVQLPSRRKRFKATGPTKLGEDKKNTLTVKYRGVCWNKCNKSWKASIKSRGKSIHIGYFDDVKDAAIAYDLKAFELRGANAVFNFPDSVAKFSSKSA